MITAILVFTATVAVTAVVRRCVIPFPANRNRGTGRRDREEGGDSSDDDVETEADDSLLLVTPHRADSPWGAPGRGSIAAPDGGGIDQENRTSSGGSSSVGRLSSARASSAETVVAAYHHPRELQPI